MRAVRIQDAAGFRLDEIYRYARDKWGEAQAARYIEGLFAAFDSIGSGKAASRPIPAAFGVNGFFVRYESHFIYWRDMPNGDVGIVTILRARMHQIERFREDFGGG